MSTTISTTTTTTTSLLDAAEDVHWYDFIGPVIAMMFVLVLVVACSKCILEVCRECKIFKRSRSRATEPADGHRDGHRNVSISIDLPPSYSTTVVSTIDLESNIILETESERRRRELRHNVIGIKVEEDKLPTYLEIIDEDSTKYHQNHAFEDGEEETDKNRGSTENLDAISVSTDTNLPPPPPYGTEL